MASRTPARIGRASKSDRAARYDGRRLSACGADVSGGAQIVCAACDHAALVRADGTILSLSNESIGTITGSIHKIGALAQGLPACNGWTFWHFERDGRCEPIDALRSLLRARLREAAE